MPRRRPVPQLQTTIMVDVLFILLVFFILVSEIREAEVDVALPELQGGAKKKSAGTAPRRLRVAVDSQGQLYLDGTPHADLDSLRAALEAARETADGASPTVALRADRASRSGQTIRVIHLLSRLGFERIHFEAEAKGDR